MINIDDKCFIKTTPYRTLFSDAAALEYMNRYDIIIDKYMAELQSVTFFSKFGKSLYINRCGDFDKLITE